MDKSRAPTTQGDHDTISQLQRTLKPLWDLSYPQDQTQIDKGCLQDVHTILEQIQAWIDDVHSQPVFWLHGENGTGKTTLMRAVTTALESNRRIDGRENAATSHQVRLGGSLFFRPMHRGIDDLRVVVRTLAAQLLDSLPELDVCMTQAMQAMFLQFDDLEDRGVVDLWTALILMPLDKLQVDASLPLTVVFVIDGLDQCPGDSYSLVRLLPHVRCLQTHVCVRVLVTTRQAPMPYRRVCPLRPNRDNGVVLKCAIPKRDGDIARFFEARLRDIWTGNSVKKSFPSRKTMNHLVRKSNGSFAFASTGCSFIESGGNVAERFNVVLDAVKGEKKSSLANLYIAVLRFETLHHIFTVENNGRPVVLRDVLDPLVTMLSPLSVRGFIALIYATDYSTVADISRSEVTKEMLRCLGPVIFISDDEERIELRHSTFRAFRTCNIHKGEFWVDKKRANYKMLQCCLNAMSRTLKRNICNLESLDVSPEHVSSQVLREKLPEHVRYACCHWIQHACQCDLSSSDWVGVYNFLTAHFIHWVEAMGLMGKIVPCIRALDNLLASITALSSDQNAELKEFIYDAKRCLLTFRPVIENTPLQIYTSALLFAPEKSIIRKQFAMEIPSWINRRPKPSQCWNPLLHEAFHDIEPGTMWPVNDLCFSPDGKFLACTTYPIIWLRDTSTWRTRQIFHHSKPVSSASFSPDSQLIASTSEDGAVRVWTLATGLPKVLLQGSPPGRKVLFSSDGTKIFSAADNGDVHAWNTKTHTLLLKFRLHEVDPSNGKIIEKMILSSNSRRVLFLLKEQGEEYRGTAQLWDARKGKLQHQFRSVVRNGVFFSSDGTSMMCVFENGTAKWCTGRQSSRHTALHLGEVKTVALSPNGRTLAYVLQNQEIRLWDLETHLIRVLEAVDFEPIDLRYLRIAWLPGGSFLAAVTDRRILVWHSGTGTLRRSLSMSGAYGYNHPRIVAFSPDGKFIVNGAYQRAQIWDYFTEIPTEVSIPFRYIRGITPDGELAVATTGDELQLWDTKSDTLVKVLRPQEGSNVTRVLFASNNRRMISITETLLATVWDRRTWTRVNDFTLPNPEALEIKHFSLRVSPDGKILTYMVGILDNRCIAVCDTDTGKLLHCLKDLPGRPITGATSVDGRLLGLSFTKPPHYRVWDMKTGSKVQAMECEGPSSRVAFTEDNNIIALKQQSSIQLWDRSTGEMLSQYDGQYRDFTVQGMWVRTPEGQIDISPVLGASSDQTKKGLSIQNKWISECQKRLIKLPRHCHFEEFFFPDPVLTEGNFCVYLTQWQSAMTSIGVDDTEDRTL